MTWPVLVVAGVGMVGAMLTNSERLRTGSIFAFALTALTFIFGIVWVAVLGVILLGLHWALETDARQHR